MIVDVVSVDMALLGAKFANMDSADQAAFFHGLARELDHFESRYKAQLQFAFVAKELAEVDKLILDNVLPMLAPERSNP